MVVDTIFECRCCGAYVHGKSDGSFNEPGWRRISNIDGPNALCPVCAEHEDCLNDLFLDGYEDAKIL